MTKAGAFVFFYLLAASVIQLKSAFQIGEGQFSFTTAPVNISINNATSAKQVLNVLFATNEDCDLSINGQSQGPLLKKEFRYIQLAAGRHTYTAKSRATGDELTDSFSISEGALNEFFLDLLYLIDQKNSEREALKTAQNNAVRQPVVTVQPVVNKMTDVKPISSHDAELQTIYSLTVNMVPVKGGSFVMGNNRSPFADEAEHRVSIDPLLFSKYEVTQHQWQTIMGNNPSTTRDCPTCPVDNVSWEEVLRFIRTLNGLSGKNFRLPKEAEWEYVARIGGKLEIDTAGGPEQYIKKTAWYFANSKKGTHPVGLRQPNAVGVFDLMGNVSEWCQDWYGMYNLKDEAGQLNPEGPSSGNDKIVRGGNYKDYTGDRFRPSLRNRRKPLEKSSEVGFRLVMDIPN